MRLEALVVAVVLFLGSPASAQIVTVQSAVGPITVAAALAQNFVGFFAELVSVVGYRPRRVSCYASGGHVRHSRHYSGAACDVDQTGWDRTAAPMRSAAVTALARAHGLQSGCEFRGRRDCGHVQATSGGRVVAGARRHARVVRAHYRHRHYARAHYYRHRARRRA